MYYPSSENKGADQLRGYREADLRLCFRLCRLLVFPRGGSNKHLQLIMSLQTRKKTTYGQRASELGATLPTVANPDKHILTQSMQQVSGCGGMATGQYSSCSLVRYSIALSFSAAQLAPNFAVRSASTDASVSEL